MNNNLKKKMLSSLKCIVKREISRSTLKCCSFMLYQPPEPEIPERLIYKKTNKD